MKTASAPILRIALALLTLFSLDVVGQAATARASSEDPRVNPYRPLESRDAPFILWEFSDVPRITSKASLQANLFSPTIPTKNIGEFFKWMSYDKVSIKGTFFSKPVAPGQGEEWYSNGTLLQYLDSTGELPDERPQFVRDAIAHVDSDIDFAAFARPPVNGVGNYEVPLVVIVISGSNITHVSPLGRQFVNSHWSVDSETSDMINGLPVKVHGVAIVSEQFAREVHNGQESGLEYAFSVACHEIAHNFGLPDMLASVTDSAPSVGIWDLMCWGSLGAGFYLDGETHKYYDTLHPTNTNPWFKKLLGWLSEAECPTITTASTVSLGNYDKKQSQYPKAAIIPIDGTHEFFIASQWRPTSFQSTLPETGLMINHFEMGVSSNYPPYGYAVEQADGLYELECNPNYSSSRFGVLWQPNASFESSSATSGGSQPKADCNPEPGAWQDMSGECRLNIYSHPGSATGMRIRNLGAPAPTPGTLELATRVQFEPNAIPRPGPPQVLPLAAQTTQPRPRFTVENDVPCTGPAAGTVYDFSVSTNPNFMTVVVASGLVPEGPGGLTSWIPSSALPGGSYYWRARARVNSIWTGFSPARAFTVSPSGREIVGPVGVSAQQLGTSGDLDGDGKDEAIVLDSTGRILITAGSDLAAHPAGESTPAKVIQLSSASGDLKYFSIRCGDLDADGRDDLVIAGHDFYFNNLGQSLPNRASGVAVVYGRSFLNPSLAWPTQLPTPNTASEDVFQIIDHSNSTLVGAGLEVAETDLPGGTSFLDLIIGAPCYSSDGSGCPAKGRLELVKGQAAMPRGTWVMDSPTQPAPALSRTSILSTVRHFGWGVSAGHLLGQGMPTVIATGERTGEIQIIYLGSVTGPTSWDGMRLVGATDYGRNVQFVDLNGDGFDELFAPVVGVIDGRAVSGAATVLGLKGRSQAQFETDFPSHEVDLGGSSVPGKISYSVAPEVPDGALALSSADLAGSEGYKDLLIGSQRATTPGKVNCGVVYVVVGSASLPTSLDLGAFPDAGGFHFEGSRAADQFGKLVSTGDFNGDGHADFLAAAPGQWLLDPYVQGLSIIIEGPLQSGSAPMATPSPDEDRPAGIANHLAVSPNPVMGSSVVSFSLSHAGRVQLAVFDLQGRRVADLLDEHMERGDYQVRFDSKSAGRDLPSGIYFVKLASPQEVRVAKLLLLPK